MPLDTAGRPSTSGRYVLLSIGMSNTTQEFCGGGAPLQPTQCEPGSFMAQASADPQVNHATLALANGAYGGKSAGFWTDPRMPDYDRIRDSVLRAQRLTEKQVQAVWLTVANPGPTTSLPAPNADAYTLEAQTGQIVRALATRYPNLQQVFVTSRIYAGYALITPRRHRTAAGLLELDRRPPIRKWSAGRRSVSRRAGPRRHA